MHSSMYLRLIAQSQHNGLFFAIQLMMITNKTLKMVGPHPFFNTAAYARTNQLAPGMEGKSKSKSNKKKGEYMGKIYHLFLSV